MRPGHGSAASILTWCWLCCSCSCQFALGSAALVCTQSSPPALLLHPALANTAAAPLYCTLEERSCSVLKRTASLSRNGARTCEGDGRFMSQGIEDTSMFPPRCGVLHVWLAMGARRSQTLLRGFSTVSSAFHEVRRCHNVGAPQCLSYSLCDAIDCEQTCSTYSSCQVGL